jgi:DNA-binding transcriptional ArsR family regulator
MVRRILASTLVALLVVALFVPTGLAAPNPSPTDRTVAVEGPGDDDGFLVDRIQAALFSPVPARSGETLRSQPSDRLERERERDRDGVLEQSTRAAIYRAIDEAPGRTLSALAEAVGVTPSTVRYHVDVLRDAGFVDAVEASGALRFAPADADLDVVAELDADGTGSVLRAVAEHEPVSVTALAEATDRAPSTVSHHLSGLEARGLVERERVGESVATTLSPTARSTLGGETTVSADD